MICLPEIVNSKEKPRRIVAHVHTKASSNSQYFSEIFLKLSTLSRLQRTIAYVLRFRSNCRCVEKKPENLTTIELKNSLFFNIKVIQNKYFLKEIDSRFKDATNKLKSLHPFIDSNGLLRVGGKLKYANISLLQRHPLIIPYESHVTRLIIKLEHERLPHAGPHCTLSNLRLKFWPLWGRRAVYSVIHKCVKCAKIRAITSKQLMADLPAFRVNPSRPFQYTGVDYSGLVSVQRPIITKGYIYLFVCIACKAFHSKFASDMSTKTFLNCLTRFISRRGTPTKIFNDNGSNFVGARNELNNLYKFLNSKIKSDQIIDTAANKNLVW